MPYEKMPCHITDGPQTPDDEPDYVRELEIAEEKGEQRRQRERDEAMNEETK